MVKVWPVTGSKTCVVAIVPSDEISSIVSETVGETFPAVSLTCWLEPAQIRMPS